MLTHFTKMRRLFREKQKQRNAIFRLFATILSVSFEVASMFSPQLLSKDYFVRPLKKEDTELLYRLCARHTDYYRHLGKALSKASLLHDLSSLPPGASSQNKHYLGYFDKDGQLVAVLELIFAYPEEDCVLLGFFMMNDALQGQGIGSKLMKTLFEVCRKAGFKEILLSYAEGNRQSEHFWRKQGFLPTGDIDEEEDNDVRLIAMSLLL